MKKDKDVFKTLERIENKIDSLIENQNTCKPATISISFKDYESFEKAIKDIYSTDLPFELMGFKSMNVNQSGENFFKERGYEFERIDIKEYFSKENKKRLIKEFKKYFNLMYRKRKNR